MQNPRPARFSVVCELEDPQILKTQIQTSSIGEAPPFDILLTLWPVRSVQSLYIHLSSSFDASVFALPPAPALSRALISQLHPVPALSKHLSGADLPRFTITPRRLDLTPPPPNNSPSPHHTHARRRAFAPPFLRPVCKAVDTRRRHNPTPAACAENLSTFLPPCAGGAHGGREGGSLGLDSGVASSGAGPGDGIGMRDGGMTEAAERRCQASDDRRKRHRHPPFSALVSPPRAASFSSAVPPCAAYGPAADLYHEHIKTVLSWARAV
ncbi:hypothetical protein R3P38DRAFT_3168473 [Favolaschia claudopus]|uniref:Uncharacterized protein n=1 Tax=Favolaschia claudopus TaxID=2862362 RepID=A0AAW0EAD4_9AGAR